MLVDDHSEVRSTTAAVLEDCGHKVMQAANGADAIAAAFEADWNEGRRLSLDDAIRLATDHPARSA